MTKLAPYSPEDLTGQLRTLVLQLPCFHLLRNQLSRESNYKLPELVSRWYLPFFPVLGKGYKRSVNALPSFTQLPNLSRLFLKYPPCPS
jgi:hypothetical protein